VYRFLLLPALLLASAAARAEGPVAPPEGGDPMEEIKKAAAKITQGMKDSEEALTRLARGEKADPKGVDVDLPKNGDPAKPPPSPAPGGGGGATGGGGGGGESLEKSAQRGREVVDGINKILESAAKLGGKSGGGGGGGKAQSGGEDPENKDGEKQRNAKKDQEEKKDPLKDNQKKDGEEPKGGEKNKDPQGSQKSKGKTDPPPPPTAPPSPRDPRGVFFAQLPAKVREAVLAGDFDQVPERYRDLIREWTKKLAEKETEEAAK